LQPAHARVTVGIAGERLHQGGPSRVWPFLSFQAELRETERNASRGAPVDAIELDL